MAVAVLLVLASGAGLPAVPAVATAAATPGSLWAASVPVDAAAPYADGEQIGGLSCPSASFCVAVDWLGTLLTSTTPTAPGRGSTAHGRLPGAFRPHWRSRRYRP